MSPELFEQLYLAPHSRVKGDLRQKLGNPTPLGKIRLTLSLDITDSSTSFGWLLALHDSCFHGIAWMARFRRFWSWCKRVSVTDRLPKSLI